MWKTLQRPLKSLKNLWLRLQTQVWRLGFFTHSINVEGLSTSLDVVSKGRHDGTQGIPNPQQNQPAGTEAEIVHFCNELLRHARVRVERKHNRALRLARKLDITRDVAGLAASAHKAEARALEIRAAHQMPIAQALEIGAEREDEYNAFQTEHKLTRGAHLPRLRGLYVAFVITLAGLLTLAFAGWMSGTYTLAALLKALPWAAGCTILPALVGASALRSINHINALPALAGLIIGLGTLAALAFVALGFESVLQASLSLSNWFTLPQAWIESPMESLQNANWSIAGPIFAAGIASLLAGYAMDDSYPGFGRIRRNMDKARQRYSAKLLRLQEKTDRVFSQQQQDLSRRHNAIKRDYQRALKALNKYEEACRLCDDYQTSVTNVGGLLLARYRQANIATYPAAAELPAVVYRPPFDSTQSMTTPSDRTLFESVQREMANGDDVYLSTQQQLISLAATYSAEAEQPIVVTEAAAHIPEEPVRRKRLTGFMPSRAGAA